MSESTTEPTSVLLVGANGRLGGKTAAELSAMPQVQLRLLARPGSLQNPQKRAALAALTARGASIVEGTSPSRPLSTPPRPVSRW
jgi:hypothetical protein